MRSFRDSSHLCGENTHASRRSPRQRASRLSLSVRAQRASDTLVALHHAQQLRSCDLHREHIAPTRLRNQPLLRRRQPVEAVVLGRRRRVAERVHRLGDAEDRLALAPPPRVRLVGQRQLQLQAVRVVAAEVVAVVVGGVVVQWGGCEWVRVKGGGRARVRLKSVPSERAQQHPYFASIRRRPPIPPQSPPPPVYIPPSSRPHRCRRLSRAKPSAR